MKTNTQKEILLMIKEGHGVQPKEIVRELAISPQAVHRHLRVLKSESRIKSEGRGPQTRYFPYGVPDLFGFALWAGSKQKPSLPPSEVYCESRDRFTTRLGKVADFLLKRLDEKDLALLISVAGEIGNNSFDHNPGQWKDIPGCWFEFRLNGNRLWGLIADRGQGILRSLNKAGLDLKDEQTALNMAFEKRISGRALEHRGNGLKYVRNIITAEGKRGLTCMSGKATRTYGSLGKECLDVLNKSLISSIGTSTVVVWELA